MAPGPEPLMNSMEISEPVFDAVFYVTIRLLLCLSDMAQTHKPPLATISGFTMRLRLGCQHIPVQRQRVEACGSSGAHRQHAHTVLTGKPGARGRGDGGDGNVEQRVGIRPQMQPRLAQVPPLVVESDGLVAGK